MIHRLYNEKGQYSTLYGSSLPISRSSLSRTSFRASTNGQWIFGSGSRTQRIESRPMSTLRGVSLISCDRNQMPSSPYAGLARRGSAHRAIHWSLRIVHHAQDVTMYNPPAPNRRVQPARNQLHQAHGALLAPAHQIVSKVQSRCGLEVQSKHFKGVFVTRRGPNDMSRSRSIERRKSRVTRRNPSPDGANHIGMGMAHVQQVLSRAFNSKTGPRASVSQ